MNCGALTKSFLRKASIFKRVVSYLVFAVGNAIRVAISRKKRTVGATGLCGKKMVS